MRRIWESVKDWLWLAVVAIIGAFLLGRKPQWVREKEKDIKARKEKIGEQEDRSADLKERYEDMKEGHDEKLEQDNNDHDYSVDDIIDFVDNMYRKRKQDKEAD